LSETGSSLYERTDFLPYIVSRVGLDVIVLKNVDIIFQTDAEAAVKTRMQKYGR